MLTYQKTPIIQHQAYKLHNKGKYIHKLYTHKIKINTLQALQIADITNSMKHNNFDL